MPTVNMLDAKTNLSRYVDAVEKGLESEIVIARNGRPAARLVAVDGEKRGIRLGLAKGKIHVPDNFDALDEEIAKLFLGGTDDESQD